jgi:hypothetical protein
VAKVVMLPLVKKRKAANPFEDEDDGDDGEDLIEVPSDEEEQEEEEDADDNDNNGSDEDSAEEDAEDNAEEPDNDEEDGDNLLELAEGSASRVHDDNVNPGLDAEDKALLSSPEMAKYADEMAASRELPTILLWDGELNELRVAFQKVCSSQSFL